MNGFVLFIWLILSALALGIAIDIQKVWIGFPAGVSLMTSLIVGSVWMIIKLVD